MGIIVPAQPMGMPRIISFLRGNQPSAVYGNSESPIKCYDFCRIMRGFPSARPLITLRHCKVIVSVESLCFLYFYTLLVPRGLLISLKNTNDYVENGICWINDKIPQWSSLILEERCILGDVQFLWGVQRKKCMRIICFLRGLRLPELPQDRARCLPSPLYVRLSG